jgi:hypothetical protein
VSAFCGLEPFAQILVAREAEFSLFIHSHSLNIASVGIMACETFPFCKRVMVRAGHLGFHEIPMALSAHQNRIRFTENPNGTERISVPLKFDLRHSHFFAFLFVIGIGSFFSVHDRLDEGINFVPVRMYWAPIPFGA